MVFPWNFATFSIILSHTSVLSFVETHVYHDDFIHKIFLIVYSILKYLRTLKTVQLPNIADKTDFIYFKEKNDHFDKEM